MAKVLAGQQARGGGGKTFERQVRHTSGKKRTGDTKNPPSVNKYKNLIGQTKPKQEHPHGWMQDCRCKGVGTCSVCIRNKKNAQKEDERREIAKKAEKELARWVAKNNFDSEDYTHHYPSRFFG